MANIELRNNTWFATLHVPPDVRETIGKSKLIKTLKTPDKRLARERALPIIAEWKAQIREARSSSVDNFTLETMKWRDELRLAKSGLERETLELLMTDKAEALEATKGYQHAKAFADMATGKATPIAPLIAPWEASIAGLAAKTKALYVPIVTKMAAKFKTLEAIDRKSVKAWIIEMQASGLSGSTIQRALGACQNFWEYLQARDIVDEDATPFKGHKVKTKKQSYKPFKPAEVVTLWKLAADRHDQPLSDLIKLGAYTGARIEELCQTKVEHLTKHNSILLPGTKTAAALREVPIHSAIKGLINGLAKASTDGYLIPSTANNKLGNRSDPHSKAFGRLKGELGYAGDRTHAFHSIRGTLVTMLENAGVPEGVVADIVGHEKQTITFGLYSGGNELEVKRKALEKAKYPA